MNFLCDNFRKVYFGLLILTVCVVSCVALAGCSANSDSVPKYLTTIRVESDGNWFFNKYDFDVSIDDSKLFDLPHGDTEEITVKLTAGEHILRIRCLNLQENNDVLIPVVVERNNQCFSFVTNCEYMRFIVKDSADLVYDSSAQEDSSGDAGVAEERDTEPSEESTSSDTGSSQKETFGMEEKVYWEAIASEMETLLKEHGFFVFRVDYRMPYCNFHIEYGVATEEGKYRREGLGRAEYEEKVNTVKAKVYELLDTYPLRIKEGLFSRPHRYILGLHFYNRFVDEYVNYSKARRYSVADHQINLSEYYLGQSDFVIMDGFDADMWRKTVYKLQK